MEHSAWFWILFLALAGWKIASWIIHFAQRAQFEEKVQEGGAVQETAADGDRATMHVYRLPSFVGALNPHDIYWDEVAVTSLKNGRYAVLAVPPGEHVLLSTGAPNPLKLTIAAGEKVFVRSGVTGGTGFLEVTDAEKAQREVAPLKPVNPGEINAQFR